MPLIDILKPFFEIVKSEETSGPITAVTFQSLVRILNHSTINLKLDNADQIIHDITAAVKHCQFQTVDSTTDQLILHQLLEVFVNIIRSECGVLLREDVVVGLAKSCFKIGRETRPGVMLRKRGESALETIVDVSFKRVLNKELESMDMLLDFVIDISDPSLGGKTLPIREMGLSLISNILEIFGNNLPKFPTLLKIAKDRIIRSLLRNATSEYTTLRILSLSLRGFKNMMTCALDHLHEQIEVFIHAVHLKQPHIAQNAPEYKYINLQIQELVLESLVEICSDWRLPSHFYLHYDCNPTSSNLFESICDFLSRNIKQAGQTLHVLNVLSLQALLAIVKGLNTRCEIDMAQMKEDTPVIDFKSPAVIEHRLKKETKLKMMDVAEKITKSPKVGIDYLCKSDFYDTDEVTPKHCAQFLWKYRNWIGINALGEALIISKPFYEEMLTAYMGLFDFSGKELQEALRIMTSKFFLSGEGQQIQRLLGTFSTTYCRDNPDSPYLNHNNIWLVAVAIIMLHSDLHKKQNKRKMDIEQFLNNVSFALEGEIEIDRVVFEHIYNDVKESEMLCVNFAESHKSDYAWKTLIQNSESYKENRVDHASLQPLLDREMFERMWGNLIIATGTILDITQDQELQNMSFIGYKHCASIASYFQLTNACDQLVIALCKMTRELSMESENNIMSFGDSYRAQLAARTVFSITHQYGSNLREGWKNILDLIIRIYSLKLLPEHLLLREAYLKEIPLTKLDRKEKTKTTNSNNTGFWGFWGSAPEDVAAEKMALENAEKCIQQCRIPELLNEARFLHPSSLNFLVSAIILGSSNDVFLSMFCNDLLIDITISNAERLDIIWNKVYQHLSGQMSNVCKEYNHNNVLRKRELIVLEHIVLSIFRLMIALSDRENFQSKALSLLQLLKQPSSALLIHVVPQLCQLILVFTTKGKTLHSSKFWELLMQLGIHGVKHEKTTDLTMKVFNRIVEKELYVFPDNVPLLIDIYLNSSLSICAPQMYKVFHNRLKNRLTEQPYRDLWLKLLDCYVTLCHSLQQNIRTNTFSMLQQICLDPSLTEISPEPLLECFNGPFSKLMNSLGQATPQSQMNEEILQQTRSRAVGFICRVFLHWCPKFEEEGWHQIWFAVLDFMKQCMRRGSAPVIIFESVKNMILVMNASNVFDDPNSTFSVRTKAVVQDILPQELFVDLWKIPEPQQDEDGENEQQGETTQQESVQQEETTQQETVQQEEAPQKEESTKEE